MSFPYQPINVEIEPYPDGQVELADGRHLQNDISHHRGLQITQPLLPSWPLALGILEILLGFIAAGLGVAEIFVIPLQMNPYGVWYLTYSNCFGAALWSGILLVLTGSFTVQAATRKLKHCVRRFYLMSLFSFVANLAFIILILVCYTKFLTNMPLWASELVWRPYYVVSLLGTICCVLGWNVLTIAVFTYRRSVLYGNVRLLNELGVCCIPCYFNKM